MRLRWRCRRRSVKVSTDNKLNVLFLTPNIRVHVPVESCYNENSQHWHCRPFVSHLCRYSTRSRLPKSLSQATPLRDSVLSCMLLECQFRVLLRNWTIDLCYSVAHTSSDCTSFEPTLNFCNFFCSFVV